MIFNMLKCIGQRRFPKREILALACLLCLLVAPGVRALYSNERGKYDWNLQMIGQVEEVVFIGQQQAYMVSNDAVLTLYDSGMDNTVWRRQLPLNEGERYHLRNINRNLLVHSNERAIMMNSAGHVNFETPIPFGRGPAIVEFFQLQSGELFSVFVRGEKCLVYKEWALVGQFDLTSEGGVLPAGSSSSADDTFIPQQLIFNKESQELFLVVREATGVHEDELILSSYQIDFRKLVNFRVSQEKLGVSTREQGSCRTKNFVLQQTLGKNSDAVTWSAYHAETLKLLAELPISMGAGADWTLSDDLVLTGDGSVIDLNSGKTTKIQGLNQRCSLQRFRESVSLQSFSESYAPEVTDISLLQKCGSSFKILQDAGTKVWWESELSLYELHGTVKGAFRAGNEVILQMADLSLHYIRDGKLKWHREEGLSSIRQVEIFDQASATESEKNAQHVPDYVTHSSESVSLAQVPARIVKRYLENAALITHQLVSFIQGLTMEDEKNVAKMQAASAGIPQDQFDDAKQFGFDKVLVILTGQGKVYAISSLTGAVQWMYYNANETAQQLFVEKKGGADGIVSVIVLTENSQVLLDPLSGLVTSQQAHSANLETHRFIMVNNGGDEHALVAVPKHLSAAKNEGSTDMHVVTVGKESLTQSDQPLFYTQIDEKSSRLRGYSIDRTSLKTTLVWSLALGADQQIINVRTQYEQQSLASEPAHVLPTVFGEEGALLFKYLDSNMFAVSCSRVSDPSQVTVLLLNGVTGAIIHQHTITDVSVFSHHEFATLFTENYFAASYQRFDANTGLSQQELQVVELFSSKIEEDTVGLLKAFWKGDERVTGTVYSSQKMESTPEFTMETYVLTFGVRAMALTETAHHITGRALVLITGDSQVYSISEKLFSARRPHEAIQRSFTEELQKMTEDLDGAHKPLVLKSETYQKYEPVLAQNNRRFISYDLDLVGLCAIQTFPTRLESTTQVFAYGHDLFLARMEPERGFDRLDQDFSYSMLFAAIIGINCFNLFASRYLNRRVARSTFLTH